MIKFTPITKENFPEVLEIYRQGISTQIATFQDDLPSWKDWDESHLKFCRLALVENNALLGWAALTPFSGRCAYKGVAEVSIYIAKDHRGKGVGQKLLKELIFQSEENGIWTLQSSIFSENQASIKLHEACGFRIVGIREKIGRKNGVWKDNVLMERRSTQVGL
jgi:L-amino acid N-acyltransferase YncA